MLSLGICQNCTMKTDNGSSAARLWSDKKLANNRKNLHCHSPSLTSAFSVNRTFWPLMSRWMTWWACRWARPWGEGERGRKAQDMSKGRRGEARRGEERREEEAHPEDLSGDVGYPVFLELVPFGVLHQVCDRTSSTELHHQLSEQVQNMNDQEGSPCYLIKQW